MDILAELNTEQRQAAEAIGGPVLILAGPGSGKTRVIAHRVAYLITVCGVNPHRIMAVTFTNKAAREMVERLNHLVSGSVADLTLGTFHSICARILRRDGRAIDIDPRFVIYDQEDQISLLKRSIQEVDLDPKQYAPRAIQSAISAAKSHLLTPQDYIQRSHSYFEEVVQRVYQRYQQLLTESSALDFDDLLMKLVQLFKISPEILSQYQSRYLHLLVDEFQDTNTIQYAMIQLLAGQSNKVFIVGDDDQAIYGWRGARVENIQRFQKDFPSLEVIKLEQNYRSTTTILSAANALIDNNADRMGKKLWSSGEDGEPIIFYNAYDERDEVKFVVDKIKQFVDAGNARADTAILYRSNVQSRVFEERFVSEGIPYRVYGGMRFFERAEIRNALAYLRLMDNQNDDASFERVVNTPTRGIGERSVEKVRETAKQFNQPLWQAAKQILKDKGLPARASNALQGFLDLIAGMQADSADMMLHEQVAHVVHNVGLIEYYEKEKTEKAQARVENIEELISAARGFDYDQSELEVPMSELTAFLTHAALEAGEGQAAEWDDCVQLMTLHSAKGLEFPLVFMVGMEEGLFPSQRSLEEEGKLEE
ncbi:MAG: UvrD-helicase domain-containing protein, partial [Desulfobacterales bacterium]|nr:UvrD-helicase domain-containing protein [Desulfobacterales bacterium]